MWRVLRSVGLITSALASASIGASDQNVSPTLTADRLVLLQDGRQLHIRCMGAGTPTVILNAGMSADFRSWLGVQPRIAKLTRVCSWDRPGHGKSDPSDMPLDAAYVASQLELLLATGQVAPPYVIVGHSYGGFEALMFAHMYPKATAAVVLVDPSFPHHERVFAAASPSFGREYKKLQTDRIELARKCLAMPDTANHICMGQSKSFLRSHLSIYENWDRSSDEVESIRSLGRLPLYVLTAKNNADDGSKVAAAWIAMHERYAHLSSIGIHRVVPGATHMMQDDRPDVLVATIAEAIAASQKGHPAVGR